MRRDRELRVSPTTRGRAWTSSCLRAFAVVLVSAGCGSGFDRAPPRSVLWESGFDYVRIEAQDGIERGTPANEHPVRFTAEQVRNLLDALRIRPLTDSKSLFQLAGRDGAKPVALFSAVELDKIAHLIADGLARAGLREDVTVAVSSLREGPIVDFLETSRTTSARIFVHDGRLNLVFGIVHAALKDEVKKKPTGTPKGAYVSRIDEKRYQPRPGSRISPAPVSLVLDPHPAVSYAGTAGRRRADWVLIDPELVLAEVARAAEREARPEAAAAELEATTERIAREQAALERKVEALERELRNGRSEAPPAAGAAVVAPATPAVEVEERLAQLRDLYDRKIIGEDLYLAKSGELVAGLRSLPVEDRLKRLTALYESGLIAKSVYFDEANRALDGE